VARKIASSFGLAVPLLYVLFFTRSVFRIAASVPGGARGG
jgi:hypothetical protein